MKVSPFPPVIVIRHGKEKRSKCTLEPLVGKPGFTFLKASPELRHDGTGHVLLRVHAPVLTEQDAGKPLLILDSTWRLLPFLESCVVGQPVFRSLPAGTQTAYPRKSKMTDDPGEGLASIEALYLALRIMGYEAEELLEAYRWKEDFLAQFNS